MRCIAKAKTAGGVPQDVFLRERYKMVLKFLLLKRPTRARNVKLQ